MGPSSQTDIQVRLSGVHLCCGGCADAVIMAVESVPGAACQVDMAAGVVDLVARDRHTAQRALDAIAAAGLHGDTGDAHLAMKTECELPTGKVHRLRVSEIHNCCDPCYDAIEGAIRSVAGVTGDTARPGATSFEVTGSFSGIDLVHALNAAGFHANVAT